MAYGQLEGHAQHHKAKATFHGKMASHHHRIAGEHEKMQAHHSKMAGEGVGQAEDEPEGGEGLDENVDTVQNTRVGGMFGRGPR